MKSGMTILQMLIEDAITKVMTNDGRYNTLNLNLNNVTRGYISMPMKGYKSSTFWTMINETNSLPMLILVGFIYCFNQVVLGLVNEKSKKIKEGIQMLGGSFLSWWMSWYLWFAIEFFIISIGFAFAGKYTTVFQHSNVWLILIWCWLFTLTGMAWG